MLATGCHRHVLLVPQSPTLRRGQRGRRGTNDFLRPGDTDGGGMAEAKLRASRAGKRDIMGEWSVNAIVVHANDAMAGAALPLSTWMENEGEVWCLLQGRSHPPSPPPPPPLQCLR